MQFSAHAMLQYKLNDLFLERDAKLCLHYEQCLKAMKSCALLR